MCFSAIASFTAGITLSAVGVITLKKSESPTQLMFSGIPLIFGIQQLTEGVVWMALNNPDYIYLKMVSVHIFIAFAQVIWPFWVPASMLLLETEPIRKKFLYFFTALGFLVSFYLGYCLAVYPIDASVASHHIYYDLSYPIGVGSNAAAFYLFAIVLTPFLCGIKKMWVVGMFTLLSYLAAKLFFEHYVVSVWCMFAAIISLVVLYMMPHLNKHYRFHKKLFK